MIINKQVDLGEYKFKITIESKTDFAHAVLTNKKDVVNEELENTALLLRAIAREDNAKRNGL